MKIFEIIAERRIREAMERGEFDNLSCKGKPLPPDGLDGLPEDMRMAVKILKNAGVVPEEVELRKGMYNISQLISACTSERERADLRKAFNEKQLRYNMLMERRNGGLVEPQYHDKIMRKLGGY